MDAAWLDFVRDNSDDIQSFIDQLKTFKKELRNRVSELRSTVEFKDLPGSRQYLYREAEDLSDYLVHDIKVAPDLTVAVDAVVSPRGWTIKLPQLWISLDRLGCH
jgi:hypothetical protein